MPHLTGFRQFRQLISFMTESNSGTWRHPPSLCVAGLAPDDIHHCFAWQPWHLATSTFTLRGRRGTWRQPPSFCVAGKALGTLCHTQLCHTPSFTHNFVRHSLSHTLFHTPSLSHTIFHTLSFTHHLCHTPSFAHHLCTQLYI